MKNATELLEVTKVAIKTKDARRAAQWREREDIAFGWKIATSSIERNIPSTVLKSCFLVGLGHLFRIQVRLGLARSVGSSLNSQDE